MSSCARARPRSHGHRRSRRIHRAFPWRGIPDGTSSLYFPHIVRGEIDLKSSYTSLPADFQRALRLMEDGVVDPDTIIDRSYSRFDD